MEINKKYEHLRDWIATLPERFESEGEHVYGGQRNWIKKFTAPDGTVLNVKRYHRPRFINLLVYSFGLRKPKGQRAWEYPAEIYKRGFDTPEPVAYMEQRQGMLLGYSYFVSLQCPYRHDMYEFGNARKGTYEDFCSAFGRYTARLHNAGILHRDYSPGNILWDKDENGNFVFSLVDINRLQIGPVSKKQGCANFARLWGSMRFFMLTARSYATARGYDINETERLITAARKKFWTKYLKKHTVDYRVELYFFHPLTHFPRPMKILVIRFRQMGDAILATSLLNTLRDSFPDAQIDFVLNERLARLFEGHPSLSRVITFTDDERHHVLTYLRKVRRIVTQTHYDAIIDLRSTVNTMPFALFSRRTKYRIGLAKPYSRLAYNYVQPECRANESMIDHNLAMLRPLRQEGTLKPNKQFTLSLTEDERADYRRYLTSKGLDLRRPILLAGVTAKLPHKTWDEERMTWTLRQFMAEWPEVQVIFNYAPGREKENALRIYERLGRPSDVFIDVEARSQRELVALADACTLYFGNEGGARHVAHACGRPSFVVCAPGSSKTKWLPQNATPAEGVAPADLADVTAMTREQQYRLITAEEVWDRFREMCVRLKLFG